MFAKSTDYIKRLVRKIADDEMLVRASGVSFYILLAFFPFVIILFLLSSLISSTVSHAILDTLELLPEEINVIIHQLVTNMDTSIAVIASMLGVSLWTLSGALVTISRSLNVFCNVHERRNFIIDRLMALLWAAMMLVMIVAIMILIVFGDIIGNILYTRFNIVPHGVAVEIIGVTVLIAVEASVLAVMYKSMINTRIEFLSVIKGALFAVVMWIVSSYAFAIYVNNFSRYHILYGSIAGVVILITWIYITSLAVLLGGEINSLKQ